MLQGVYKYYNSVTAPEGQAGGCMDIEGLMERYAVNLTAARVLKVIDRLVRASRRRGVKDGRGIPYCYASKEWMAGQLGKSVRTIARAIHDLKAAGLIECKRTRSNAMLFITGDVAGEAAAQKPAEDREATAAGASSSTPVKDTSGTSGNAENGTSSIPVQSNNIPSASSIHRSNTPEPGDGGERSAHAPEAVPRARFDAERRRIYDELRWQLIRTGAGGDDMTGPCDTSARYIADVVAGKQDVKVNGTTMSSGQYWEVVQHVNGGHLCETIRAVAARDCLGGIRNKRAYLLASVYNCALWDRFREADVEFRALWDLAEGVPGRWRA